MIGIESFLGAVLAAWLLVLFASSVRLVTARTPDESESARRVLTAAVIAGFVITVAPHVAKWITGFGTYTYNGKLYYSREDPNDPASGGIDALLKSGKAFSPEISEILDKLVNGITLFGGLVVTVGVIWGAIKMRVRGCRKLSGQNLGAAALHALHHPR